MQKVIQKLIAMEKGLVFLSAPTKAGKTKIIQALKHSNGIVPRNKKEV